MFNLNKQRKIYSKLYKKHGHSVTSLHWRSKRTQQIRFEALCELAPKNGQSVLDIGCGFGDFFTYLDKHYSRLIFYGCEIIPEFARISKITHPYAKIYESCYLKLPNLKPDLIYASGIFGFGDYSFFKHVCKKALLECQKGFAFNICTDDKFNRVKVDQAYAYLSRLTTVIEVVEGYLENDITFLAHPQIALRARYQSQLSPLLSF